MLTGFMEFYEVSSDFEMRFAKFMLLLLGFQGFLWDLMEVEWNCSGGAKLVLSSGSPTWQSGIIDSTYDLSEILVMLWDFIAFHWFYMWFHGIWCFFQVGLSGLFVGKFSGRSWKYVCNILNANNMCKDINGRNQLDAHHLRVTVVADSLVYGAPPCNLLANPK